MARIGQWESRKIKFKNKGGEFSSVFGHWQLADGHRLIIKGCKEIKKLKHGSNSRDGGVDGQKKG